MGGGGGGGGVFRWMCAYVSDLWMDGWMGGWVGGWVGSYFFQDLHRYSSALNKCYMHNLVQMDILHELIPHSIARVYLFIDNL